MEYEIKGTHEVVLKDLMPSSREYPAALFEASSILVSEQPNLIPAHMDSGMVSYLEATVMQHEENSREREMAADAAVQTIDRFRGRIKHMIEGMEEYGMKGFPDMMVLTNDLASRNPAIVNPNLGEYCFQIIPKRFDLGLTGRLLTDDSGNLHNERLFVDMGILDAYDFALSLSPQTVVAIMPDRKGKVIYEKSKEIGRLNRFDNKREKRTLLFDQEERSHWLCKSEVLETDGLRVTSSPIYKKVRKYGDVSLLFGHPFANIEGFLEYAVKHDDHLIWKICKRDLRDANTALLDAEPTYGTYQGRIRPEHLSRLHFMPNKGLLWFDGTSLHFDRERGMEALFNLGHACRDIWIDNSIFYQDHDSGWDIIIDKKRRITPDNPVKVNSDGQYMQYGVLA